MKLGETYIRKFVITPEKAVAILTLSGYKKHRNGSFVKEISNEKRFHAYIKEKHIELHIDKTYNGRHAVIKVGKRMSDELKKFSKARVYLNPNKIAKIKKSIVAPNVKELQKQASLLNKNHKVRISKKIENYLKHRLLNGRPYKFLQHVLNLL